MKRRLRIPLAVAAVLLLSAGDLLPKQFREPIAGLDRYLIRPIPKGVALQHFVFTDGRVIGDPNTGENKNYRGEGYKSEVTGWVVEESAERFRVLDVTGIENTIAKRGTDVTPVPLGTFVGQISGTEEFGLGPKEPMRINEWPGAPSMSWISIPRLMASRLLLAENNEARVAELLKIRMQDTRKDIPSFRDMVSDVFADAYNHQMLMAFARRDYARALELAQHLMRPEFAKAESRPIAERLRRELPARRDDFKSFRLPTPTEWASLGEKLSRPEKIKYLAERLRLLNCWQDSQPGGIGYGEPQWAAPRLSLADDGDVVNPFTALRAMQLTPTDLEVLAPLLLDDSYMPSFSFHRDFMSGRTLHQANWAVASLMNEAAGTQLADLHALRELRGKERQQYVDKIVDWCRTHKVKTRGQLLLESLRTTTEFRQFRGAAEQALELHVEEAVPILVERHTAFKTRTFIVGDPHAGTTNGAIAHLVHDFGTPQSLEAARGWLKDPDRITRFWAALTVVEHGAHAQLEGVAELRTAILEDKSFDLTPAAIDPLLALKHPEALAAAEVALDNIESVHSPFQTMDVLQHLAFGGSQRARLHVHTCLADETTVGNGMGIHGGGSSGPIGRPMERNDACADDVASWSQGKASYDREADATVRREGRKRLGEWFDAALRDADSGKVPATLRRPLRASEWMIDGAAGLIRPPE